ncbi:MAG: bifunctional phosphoribosylaminoimidazolecarboxamide formyltransferase/IMP cyclohydrolase [Planctomycetota bacterium]
MSQREIRRALLSVSDKTGIVEFARVLHGAGVEILSTGGTAKALRDAGIPILDVGEFTGFPEMLDGRVKTLHPKVHGGILYRRDLEEHVRTLEEHQMKPIDLVAVNLYPFESTVAKPGVTYEGAIEQIDIGGPSMVRSAAKNHASVVVVCDPSQYPRVLAELDANGGATTFELRRELAAEAFRRTADYDRAIRNYFDGVLSGDSSEEESNLPAQLDLGLARDRVLRYGENPHQSAALYGDFLNRFDQLHGKAISYNNLLDLAGAIEVAGRLSNLGTAVSIIKHSNPCGAAVGENVAEAYRAALSTDPQSASGGIIAVTAPIDGEAAEAMSSHFIEILVAPEFSPEALEILKKKKNRILLKSGDCDGWVPGAELSYRSVPGGVLAQEFDSVITDPSEWKVVTKRRPSDEEMRALQFAWEVVRCVKSNAIVYTSASQTLGVGAGQMSRVDSARLAATKAAAAGLSLGGSVVGSDAFFPFADGLLVAAEAGAKAFVQPGGSVRDDEVIAAADEHGLAMVFTGRRHFRH